jgi:hypothetical protein
MSHKMNIFSPSVFEESWSINLGLVLSKELGMLPQGTANTAHDNKGVLLAGGVRIHSTMISVIKNFRAAQTKEMRCRPHL